MKVLILSLLLTLPTLEDLYLAIDKFWDKEVIARITAYQRTEQKPWTKFLPSIGVGYNLQGKPRPTIGISLNKIYDSLQDKELRKLTIEGIRKEIDLLREQEKIKVKELYHNYIDKTILFDFSIEEYKIDSILFSFVERDYDNPEIDMSPSDYFLKKKIYLSVKKSLKTEEIALKSTEREILTVSHFSN